MQRAVAFHIFNFSVKGEKMMSKVQAAPEVREARKMARKYNGQVDKCEKGTSVAMWHLGRALIALREAVKAERGMKWSDELERLRIPKQRALKARRIAECFKSEEEVKDLLIQDCLRKAGWGKTQTQRHPRRRTWIDRLRSVDCNAIELSDEEQQTAVDFISKVGGMDRALEVFAYIATQLTTVDEVDDDDQAEESDSEVDDDEEAESDCDDN